jgi:uncharacterized protein (DUF2062 family)
MMFARRLSPSLVDRLRNVLWPERGLGRAARYFVLRMMRLRCSPHRIALGSALGVFAAVTPLVGVQTLLAVALALVLGASVRAAILGTFVGNPVSWPVIWGASYAAGCLVLGREILLPPSDMERQFAILGDALLEGSPEHLGAAAHVLLPILTPMMTGSLLLGLITAVFCYYILRRAVEASKMRRRLA